MMKPLFIFLAAIVSCLFLGCNKKIYSTDTIKQLPKSEYLAMLDSSQNPYLLDIRTGLEYKRGHIKGAISMSFLSSEFSWQISELDTNRPVFIYCETAHRSPFATKQLKKAGFTEIYDLEGGYSTLREE